MARDRSLTHRRAGSKRLFIDGVGGFLSAGAFRMRRLVSMGRSGGSRLDLSLRELVLSDSGLQVVANDMVAEIGKG